MVGGIYAGRRGVYAGISGIYAGRVGIYAGIGGIYAGRTGRDTLVEPKTYASGQKNNLSLIYWNV